MNKLAHKKRHMLKTGLACLASMMLISVEAQAAVVVSGSDSVEPVMVEVVKDYKRTNANAAINLDAKGTGAGLAAFCKGEADIAMASRKINSKEYGTCSLNAVAYYEIAIGWDAIAVVANKGSTWLQSLTTAELATLFEVASTNNVVQWNQIRATFPATKIVLIGLDARSGTADFFSTALKGFPKMLRTDLRLESDHAKVVRLVSATPGAIGFASLTGYSPDSAALLVGIDEGTGKGPVLPSPATILNGQYDKLARLLYLYVSKTSYEAKPDAKDLVDFSLKGMAGYVSKAGVVPLTSANYETAKTALRDKKAGTAIR